MKKQNYRGCIVHLRNAIIWICVAELGSFQFNIPSTYFFVYKHVNSVLVDAVDIRKVSTRVLYIKDHCVNAFMRG